MARAPDKNKEKAKELYLEGLKLIEIANQLNLPEGTIRSWKNRYKWTATLQSEKRNVAKNKKGAQPGNKNSVGHAPSSPNENKNAETHGFFSKYLPEETFSIIKEIEKKDPLEILWENIQIAYATIVRAQNIMYVKDKKDKTIERIAEGYSDSGSSEKWEVQQAWDKQANFMKAQARAQSELRGLIKQYDEQVHRNWDLATEEQRARIEKLKIETAKLNNFDNADQLNKLDTVLDKIEGKI